MFTLFDLIIVAAILGFAYRGWVAGFEAATIEALELLACLSIAVMAHEAVAGFLHAGVVLALGDGISVTWAVAAAFSLLAWGTFAVVRLLVHQKPADDDEDQASGVDPLGDRLAGAIAGGVGGALFVGGVLVTLSMMPFLAGLKPSGDRLLLDVGKTTLRSGGQFATERHDGRPLPLWGEPASRSSDSTARLTSEPWFDADGDRKFTDVDRFRDVDANGTFSKDLYFTDVDGDGMRRIGLIDKYVVGRWDAGLVSSNRPRPAPKKEPPEAKPAVPAAAEKPAEPAKQPESAKPTEKKPTEKKPATPAAGGDKPAATTPSADKGKDKKPAPAGKTPDKPTSEKQPEDDF